MDEPKKDRAPSSREPRDTPTPQEGPEEARPGAAAELLSPQEGRESSPESGRSPSAPRRPRASEPTFAIGEVLGNRFRILRFIAQGGAGEIYEAEDQELRCPVALKVIRPEISESERAIERFRREIQLARQVTHPNVCRIFDVFSHRVFLDDGSPKDFLFLSMELLRGETLASRVRRLGPLTPAEALPLVRQMVEALKAAHRAGVIHRDFKSANVILVPTEGGSRAVVTDFGLARAALPGDADADITYSGTVVGTPSYMSPEQLTGGEITPATDTYALGIVLYEMVTGVRPFHGESDLSTAVKRLTESPPPPTTHTQDLDPVWEQAILHCLERDPADRLQSIDELVEVLSGEEEPPRTRDKEWSGAWRWAALAGVTSLAVATAAAGGFLISEIGWEPAAPPLRQIAGFPVQAEHATVAVLGFKNLSGQEDVDWLSAALSEMINMELGAGGDLETVPSESIDRVKVDVELTSTGSPAPDTLQEIRKRLRTDFIVEGSYLALGSQNGGQIRLHLRLHGSDSTFPMTVPGREAELFDLVSRAGRELRQQLGVGEVEGPRTATPARPEATELYLQGQEEMRRLDALRARELLRRAIDADPLHALAVSELAGAWSLLGYQAQAEQTSQRALDLSDPLTREEKLAIEARDHAIRGRWAAAADTYGSLFRFFPDNLEYGLGLAQAQIASGHGEAALRTVEALRSLPPPSPSDPRLDLAEAAAAGALADFRRQRQAATGAQRKAVRRSAPFLEARGRLLEGRALLELGDLASAQASARAAERIYRKGDVEQGIAEAMQILAEVRQQQGLTDQSGKLTREAQEILDRIGARDS